MLSYCLKRSKNMENKNLMIEKTKNRTIIPLSKYAVGGSKKLRFVQEQESSS